MKKIKYLTMLFLMMAFILILPNISNAAVEVTRDVYSNNGSMKFYFTGLTLDATHEYEFGFTATAATQVEEWHAITEYTASTATVDIMTTTEDLRDVFNATDTGYVTIRDKSTQQVAVEPYAVDLKIPFLQVSNYVVIPNGKEFGSDVSDTINIPIRCPSNCEAYYQYEKITDENIINKYKEIKENNGNFLELQDMIKNTPPTSNWSAWRYFNGHNTATGMNGFGYTERPISVPDSGLYYMWLYFSGEEIKNVYGCILVDNLQPDIALEGISLPRTETVSLGDTLTLTPTFNPSNATNKLVTWASSDETVATVDNAGKITPKKLGSTIITVTSQDGNHIATCTVTVVEESNNNENPSTGNPPTDVTPGSEEDTTVAPGVLPDTGIGMGIFVVLVILVVGTIIIRSKYNKLRDI